MNYTITEPAYMKLFFHLAKHPHQRVNGVLIGKETPDGGVEATDTIPLLHHWTSLSPMMEIGLDLVDTCLSAGVRAATDTRKPGLGRTVCQLAGSSGCRILSSMWTNWRYFTISCRGKNSNEDQTRFPQSCRFCRELGFSEKVQDRAPHFTLRSRSLMHPRLAPNPLLLLYVTYLPLLISHVSLTNMFAALYGNHSSWYNLAVRCNVPETIYAWITLSVVATRVACQSHGSCSPTKTTSQIWRFWRPSWGRRDWCAIIFSCANILSDHYTQIGWETKLACHSNFDGTRCHFSNGIIHCHPSLCAEAPWVTHWQWRRNEQETTSSCELTVNT